MDILPHGQREPKYGHDTKQVDAGYEMHDVSGVPAYQRLKRHAGQQAGLRMLNCASGEQSRWLPCRSEDPEKTWTQGD